MLYYSCFVIIFIKRKFLKLHRIKAILIQYNVAPMASTLNTGQFATPLPMFIGLGVSSPLQKSMQH